MAYAEPSDVAGGFRDLTDEEVQRTYTLLDRAERLLTSRIPTIAARVTAGTLDVQTVIDIEAAMVERVLRNPDGKKTESIDDYSYTRDGALSSGSLYVSDEEIALLLPVRQRARSITLQTHSTPS